MFYVYVLKSINYNKFYTGHAKDVNIRLLEHNSGKTVYSKRYMPWEVLYTEEFKTEVEAIKREKYFKSAAGRRWLKKQLNK